MMNFEKLQKALQVAIDAATEAGKLIRDEFHRVGGPRCVNSNIAYIDQIAERLIYEKLISHFPDWEYQGEELKKNLNANRKPYWSVDPNDGTAEFLKGQRGFSVSIGLIDQNGEPILGVIYSPCAPDDKGDLIAYFRGGEILRNHHTVQKNKIPENPENQILLASLGADKKPTINLELINPSRFRSIPSIAYRLALTAVGEAEIAISINSPNVWDIAGAHAILLGAGCDIMNEYQQIVRYTSSGTLTSRGKYLLGGQLSLLKRYAGIEWFRISKAESEHSEEPLFPVRTKVGITFQDSDVLSRAQGCLVGAVAGDSLGLREQLMRKKSYRPIPIQPATSVVKKNHSLPQIGQGSDATEMAMMLARSIIINHRFSLESVAWHYHWWYQSNPFYCDSISSRVFENAKWLSSEKLVFHYQQFAQQYSKEQTTGALKRIYPLAIYGSQYHISEQEIIKWVKQENSITHTHPLSLHLNIAYVLALQAAIQTGNRETAFQKAFKYAQEYQITEICDILESVRKKRTPMTVKDSYPLTVAFQNAMYHLLFTENIENAIMETIELNGDDSSNASICGAMIGAIIGYRNLPIYWRKMVLSSRPMKNFPHIHFPRPMATWSVDGLQIAERLLVSEKLRLLTEV